MRLAYLPVASKVYKGWGVDPPDNATVNLPFVPIASEASTNDVLSDCLD